MPETITYHAPCHLRAQNIGLKSRDLMKLTGAKITLVAAVLGHRRHVGPAAAENAELSLPVAEKMADEIDRRPAARSSPATATWPTAASPSRPAACRVHPIQVVARAYGIPEESTYVERLTCSSLRRRRPAREPGSLAARARPSLTCAGRRLAGWRRVHLTKSLTKGLVSGPIGFYHAGVPGSEGHAGHEAKR